MPYDVLLARGTRPASPITIDEFHAAMAGAPATRQDDRTYWVDHADGGPWFVATWEPDGRVRLSTSYASERFLRNFPDMLDLGIALASGLQAHLFEEVRAEEVTAATIDALLAPDGAYVRMQAEIWQRTRDQIAQRGVAGLPLPDGPFDTTAAFFGATEPGRRA